MAFCPRARIRASDVETWRVATWAVPFMAEVVIAVLVVTLWVLSKTAAFPWLERGWLLTGAGVTALASVVAAGYLMMSSSPRRRGLGLSVAASGFVAAVGATVVAFVFHQ